VAEAVERDPRNLGRFPGWFEHFAPDMYSSAEELERLEAPYNAQLALSNAIYGYQRFSRTLPTADPRSMRATLRLTKHFQQVGYKASACLTAVP
jgi:hypothetical protein